MDQIYAVGMMKDEEDVAYGVIAHLAGEGIDGILVADNGSTDSTRAELERVKADMAASSKYEEANCRIEILEDPEVGYYQSRKITALAAQAAERGATWIVPFDADELWVSADRVAVYLRSVPQDVAVVTAELFNHFVTALDIDGETPFERMVWRQNIPGTLPKVAVRWNPNVVIQQGNHSVIGARGGTWPGLQIRHFPYRSWEHFRRKAINGAAAYAATDLAPTEGAHWRGYGEILERHGEDALREVFDRYYSFVSPVDEHMVRDPAPYRRWNT